MLNIPGHKRNANQNHVKNLPHSCQLPSRTQTTNVGEDVGKKEPSHTADGNLNYYNHCGKQYGGLLKKLKIELSYDPVIPLLGI
jgi:hypothetical protein